MIKLCCHGCGKEATHVTKRGKYQCSDHHRKCPAVLEKGYKTNEERYGGKTPASSPTVKQKMSKTTEDRYGVTNVSSLPAVKEKKKQQSLNRYGVDNVSKSDEVKTVISVKAKERWKELYKNKDFGPEGLTRKQYSDRANRYADTQYQRHADMLDPARKRGKHWHIDHIFSVTDGFLNDVPINIISDISNLRLLADTENYAKHKKSEKTLNQLYEDYIARNRVND